MSPNSNRINKLYWVTILSCIIGLLNIYLKLSPVKYNETKSEIKIKFSDRYEMVLLDSENQNSQKLEIQKLLKSRPLPNNAILFGYFNELSKEESEKNSKLMHEKFPNLKSPEIPGNGGKVVIPPIPK